MAVPKKRTSSMKKGQRRSHHALKPVNVILCKNCSSPQLSHNICSACGFYKNKKVMNVKVKGAKKRSRNYGI